MSLKKKAIVGFVWSLLDKLFNQLGYFLLLLYLAKILTPNDFGIIGMLAIFTLVADAVVNAGFYQALVQKSQEVTNQDYSTAFVLNLGVSTLLYSILFVTAPLIALFYKQPVLVDLARVSFLVIIVNALSIVPRAKLTIAVDFKHQAMANTIAVIVSSIVAVVAVHLHFGYWSLVWMALAKSLVLGLSLFYFSRWQPSLLFDKDSFKRLFSFGSKLLIGSVAGTFVNNLYLILIGRFFSPTEVGHFSQATNLTNALSGVLSSILQSVTFPVMSSVKGDIERMLSIYQKVLTVTMFVAIPIMFGFAAITDIFVVLFFNKAWLPMIPLLIALSIARCVTPISVINLNLLNALGRSDLFLRVDLSKLPVILLSILATIPFGINVVAYGMVISSFVCFFINAYYPGKLYGFGGWQQLKVMFPMILAAIVMYTCMHFIAFNNLWLSLIVKLFAGGVVYLLSCYLLKVHALFDILLLLQRKRKMEH